MSLTAFNRLRRDQAEKSAAKQTDKQKEITKKTKKTEESKEAK